MQTIWKNMNNIRKNSYAFIGGAFGDEGKGKVVDEICSRLTKKYKKIIVYRFNGGANAGHTVIVSNKKIVLHQIPSGALIKNAIAILGKGMVIHPNDLVNEMTSLPSVNLIIDEMAVLSLDTHRAFEGALKKWEEGGAGSTGRGISPAYADVLLRHPLRLRDLVDRNWKESFSRHYKLYEALVKGLGEVLSECRVVNLQSGTIEVGSLNFFLERLSKDRIKIKKHVKNVYKFISASWESTLPFIFEGAQAVGLHPYWGVYPDITASDPTFEGIKTSTEGIIDPDKIEVKALVYKATYMSSVGKRILPTKMKEYFANRIREDANEYGATTKRPRDIYNIDLPALRFFSKIAKGTHIVLTHVDISYLDQKVKVAVSYKNSSFYRPDQFHLNNIKPIYKNFLPWDGKKLSKVKKFEDLPQNAINYIRFISKELNLTPLIITTGPSREAVIVINKIDR